MEVQVNGLSGHLDEVWDDVGPDSGWLGGKGESWERGPYFVDGLIPLAWQLGDERLKAKANRFMEWTLTHASANGMFGPASNDDWWPRMVMLKALTQYQEATDDARVIPLMSNYFEYQRITLPTRPLRDWGKFRWQDNALSVIWLYNRTGDPKLLELLQLLHQQGFDWKANFADFRYTERITPELIKLSENNGLSDTALATHGVNNGQALKAAPVWFTVSGNESDRQAFRVMVDALDKYHGLPNGMFSCDEHFGGLNPSQGSELCTVVETMYSLEVAMAVLGEAWIGDRLEHIAFNALPGTFTEDMWAHQYDQEPNQVEVSLHSKPWTTDGPESNLYGLAPHFGCCTANFHQGWPKLTANLWMSSADNGLAAIAYAPCEVHTSVQGTPVRIVEETEYPFRNSIRIRLEPEAETRFPLRLRIPSWAGDKAVIHVNGEVQPTPKAGTFAVVHRSWKSGDIVELHLPLEPRVTRGFQQSVSINRGPLLFSYAIAQDWVKLRDHRQKSADWQVYPASEWNYALAVDENSTSTIRTEETAIGQTPFTLRTPGVKLHATARKLPSWRAVDGVADPVPQSPVSSEEADEQIELVPYAAAKLRITAFPVLKS
ncbi:beta-L-arabinofuranosidase domain-containing protein [Silvibacterium sp.]|uniref:beta-L-arabinofuranosidase domain-containing protein n=1 Tax=Silvibacterium sp. TaxID=1964179 RepID=UPI0039E52248